MVQSVDTTTLFEQYETFLSERTAEWLRREAQADIDFLDQLSRQQADYESFKAGMEAWAAELNIDIVLAVGFNFDNLAALRGITYTWTPMTDSKISESIVNTGDGRVIATRVNDFSRNKNEGIVTVIETLYAPDGSGILRQTEIPWNLRERKAVISI